MRIDKLLARPRACCSGVLITCMAALGMAILFLIVISSFSAPDAQTAASSEPAVQTAASSEPAENRGVAVITDEAILKIAETIGVASLLIGWIFAVFDKTESGFYYGELVETLYPYYRWFVLIHAVALLCCLWQASVGHITTALLALAIIGIDCIPQWIILKTIVFYPSDRRAVAVHRWTQEMEQAKNNKEKYIEQIYRLSDAITLEDGSNIEQLTPALKTALRTYTQMFQDSESTVCMQNLVSIWSQLLEKRTPEQGILIVKPLLRSDEQSDAVCLLCASYIIWLLRDKTNKDDNLKSETHNASLEEISNSIVTLRLSDSESESGTGDSSQLFYYLQYFYVLLLWCMVIHGSPYTWNIDWKRLPSIRTDLPIKESTEHAFTQCIFLELFETEIDCLLAAAKDIMTASRNDEHPDGNRS